VRFGDLIGVEKHSRCALSADEDVRAPGNRGPRLSSADCRALYSETVSQNNLQKEGQLAEHPLAELIREISNAELSGALRLAHDQAKIVIYFEAGTFLFATSNLRAHRLGEVLTRSGVPPEKLAGHPSTISDQELGASLVKSGAITTAALQSARSSQAADVLRVALLWADGQWWFDSRVRVAGDLRVPLEVDRLLLQCARLLPFELVKSRVDQGRYSVVTANHELSLSGAESLMLTRITACGEGAKLAQFMTNGLPEEDCLRGVYALSLSGLVHRDEYALALGIAAKPRVAAAPTTNATAEAGSSEGDVQDLFKRLQSAGNHYEVLDVPSSAGAADIKAAYHALARRFHPDRFHQSEPEIRAKLETSFARIAQAYEVLNDAKRRATYDKVRAPRAADKSGAKKGPAPNTPIGRAETCFTLGTQALEGNETDAAIRYFSEAAILQPRQAKYRAYYGSALMRKANLARNAETELLAALAIEPNNAAFRVMLAELYRQLDMPKRAESEAERALAADATNRAARDLLAKLKGK
jgi:curved DNA-binding protein CbpA